MDGSVWKIILRNGGCMAFVTRASASVELVGDRAPLIFSYFLIAHFLDLCCTGLPVGELRRWHAAKEIQ